MSWVQEIEEGYINTEVMAKVVAVGLGAEFIQFLAVLEILPRKILKNRMNSAFSSNHPGAIHPILQIDPVQKWLATQGI